MRNAVLATILAALCAAPAAARTIEYRAALSGTSRTIDTGSAASAKAVIKVDLAAKTVAIRLDVTGMPMDALWDKLVDAPIGPIHLHVYSNGDVTDGDSAALAFPLPFGPGYRPTKAGFRVRTGARDYAKAVAPLGDAPSFDAFVRALDKGIVVLNIHTDKFNGGEINGIVERWGGRTG